MARKKTVKAARGSKKLVHVQNFAFDVTKASDAELAKVKDTILKGLTLKARLPGGGIMVDSHDRHYSTHSSG